MFASVRTYQVDPSKLADFNRHATEGFAPILHGSKGFIAYYGVDAGDGQWTSVSIFETQEGADASSSAAAEYVKAHLAPMLKGAPQVTQGTVAVAKRK